MVFPVAEPQDQGPADGAAPRLAEAPDATAQSAVGEYFQRESRFWDELYEGDDVYSEIHRLRQDTALSWIDELGLPAGSRVLELGSGAGGTAVALARRGLRVRATDAVPAMLDRARANFARAGVADLLECGLVDAQAVELPDDSVDLVVAFGVLPWLPRPGIALAEMARVTRPGGAVVANVDNAARLHYALDPRLNPHLAGTRAAVKTLLRRPPGETGARSQLHSMREFDAMLDAAGLEKLRGKAIGFGPFTMLGRRALPDRTGVRLHRSLQRRADEGRRGLAARGAQYLVLARKRRKHGDPAP
jgi:ubiquinone/menaquinone biosynthesis C-methylase UbiE